MVRRFFFILFLIPNVLSAQNPGGTQLSTFDWKGDLDAFAFVDDSILRSQTITTTALSASNTLAYAAWEFGIQLDFNPSLQNQLRMYLISDNDSLKKPLNGYFILIGESGNTDRYHLYKQQGQEISLIMSSPPKVRPDPNQVKSRIRVTRDLHGKWTLYTAQENENFAFDVSAVNNDITSSAYFGIHCLFTATNSNKFQFNYFKIDTLSEESTVIDSIPPVILSTSVLDSVSILITFDKSLDSASANLLSNYSLNNGYNHPSEITVIDSLITLFFADSLTTNDYELSIKNVKDPSGNLMRDTVLTFHYEAPKTIEPEPILIKLATSITDEDLFFIDSFETNLSLWNGETEKFGIENELLTPDVSAKSPAYLHVPNTETRNRLWEIGFDVNGNLSSQNNIRLYLTATNDSLPGNQKGYYLQVDGSAEHHQYKLYKQNNATRTLLFESPPTASQNGKVRARVKVTHSIAGEWKIYTDEYDHGDFTLLQNMNGDTSIIDNTHDASLYSGWMTRFSSSRAQDYNLHYLLIKELEEIPEVIDSIPPVVLSSFVLDSVSILITFDKSLDSASANLLSNYSLNNGYNHPSEITVIDSLITLIFADSLTTNNYELSILGIKDTSGNLMRDTVLTFHYEAPETIKPEPILIKLAPSITDEDLFFIDSFENNLSLWNGETEKFAIENEILTPDVWAKSPAYLHVPNTETRNRLWEIGFDVNGNLSSQNNIRLYLTATNDSLPGNQKGYYLQIDGSAEHHQYKLYKQNNATRTLLFESSVIANQNGKVRARVKVTNNIAGEWKIYTDEYDHGDFTLLPDMNGDTSIIDNTHDASLYSGWMTRFSSSRAQDYNLHYLLIKELEEIPEVIDTIPPAILSSFVLDSVSILITFDKSLDSASANLLSNYSLNNEYSHPAEVVLNDSLITLVFADSLTTNNYELSITNVKDTSGNLMRDTVLTFHYEAPETVEPILPKLNPSLTEDLFFIDSFENNLSLWYGEIEKFGIENEILTPDVSAKSPAYLHVPNTETRNRLWEIGFDVNGNLSSQNNIRLYLTATNDSLPGNQKGYYLQVDGSAEHHQYKLYKQNNATRTLLFESSVIANQNGKVRARVKVTNSIAGEWKIYTDEYDHGDFTLLQDMNGDTSIIDDTHDTSLYSGWMTRFSSSRAQDYNLHYLLIKELEEIPGVIDSIPPKVIVHAVVDSVSILITFDKSLDSASANLLSNYSLNNGYNHPSEITVNDSLITLIFSDSLTTNNYELSITGIKDTLGNLIQDTVLTFHYEAPETIEREPVSAKLNPSITEDLLFIDSFENNLSLWNGETEKFGIKNQILTPDVSAKSPAFVHVPNTETRNRLWEIGFDVSGNLSSQNNIRLYLTATNDSLPGNQKGYYLQIDGSAEHHQYKLYKQNNATRTLLFESSMIANQNGKLRTRVQVTNSIDGEWKIYTDEYDYGDFTLLQDMNGDTSIIDNTHDTSLYSGWMTRFSSSRAQDYNLHYLLIKELEEIPGVIDSIPPKVIVHAVVDSVSILITFDKSLDSASANLLSNYSLNNGYNHPAEIILTDSLIALVFADSLTTNDYELSITNVKDTSGNLMRDTVLTFHYEAPETIEPEPVAAKLNPSIGEDLFFIDSFENNLSLWNGETEKFGIENEILTPDVSAKSPAYLHIPNTETRNRLWEIGFDVNGNLSSQNNIRLYLTATNDSLPGNQKGYYLQVDGSAEHHQYKLYKQNNATRTLLFESSMIENQNGKVRARVKVTNSIAGEWKIYTDEYDQGDFTLLQNMNGDTSIIDHTYDSSLYSGWMTRFSSSRAQDYNLHYLLIKELEEIPEVIDSIPPAILSSFVLDSVSILITFDKSLDSASANLLSNYSLNNGYNHPAEISVNDSLITLVFADSLTTNNYELSIKNVKDTLGNLMPDTVLTFHYEAPENIEPEPVLIKLAPSITEDLFFIDSFENNLSFWNGETEKFRIENQILTPDVSAKSPAYLHIPNTETRNRLWEIGFDVNGNLSSQNNIRLYLTATNDSLPGNQKGYYLQVDGSAEHHQYKLYKQNNATRTLLFESPPTASQNGKVRARVKVTHSIAGEWKIYTDEYDQGDFTLLQNMNGDTSIIDHTYDSSLYSGWMTRFSSSRAQDYNLHYLLIKELEEIPEVIDSIPPAILSSFVLDSVSILITFDKSLDSASANLLSNYSLNNGYNHPAEISVNDSLITLVFADSLTTNNYELSILGIKDTSGNLMRDTVLTFHYEAPETIKPEPILIKLAPSITDEDLFFIDSFENNLSLWNGETEKFAIENEILTPDVSAKSPAYLHVPNTETRNRLWEIGFDVNGNLSSQNNIRLYLTATNDSLPGNQKGYYLQIDGSAEHHQYKLYKQNNATRTLLFESSVIANQNGKVRARAKVTNNIAGEWKIYTDEYDHGEFTLLQDMNGDTSIIDNTHDASLYSGWMTRFSSSRAQDYNLHYLLIKELEDLPPIIEENNYMANRYDVIINEIMADPKNANGLPNAEYVELKNTSAEKIYLKDWTFQTSSSKAYKLKNDSILPFSFIVLHRESDSLLFKNFGPTSSLVSWPNLVNTGTTLTLKNQEDTIIDEVSYLTTWYGDSQKSNGGWSLERIDPNLRCEDDRNWKASIDPSGGTPGKENSIHAELELQELEIVGWKIINSNQIQIQFNKILDTISSLSPINYRINNGIGQPNSVKKVDSKTIHLYFPQDFLIGYTHLLTVSNLSDCTGTSSALQTEFFIADVIAANDIIINEILADPFAGGAEFVEIYNHSNKTIDLSALSIGTIRDTDGVISLKKISENATLFPPKEYRLLSNNSNVVASHYFGSKTENFLELTSFPVLKNSNGTIVLMSENEVIDRFDYNENIHDPLIVNKKGVSLERVSFDKSTNESGNFKSAAATVGYATPGYQNSQFAESQPEQFQFSLQSQTFSPDNDGFEDVLQINYSIQEDEELMTTVEIYNDKGFRVRSLHKNYRLSQNGTLYWDGLMDNNQLAKVGIYILILELYNKKGIRKTIKQTCVLAARF